MSNFSLDQAMSLRSLGALLQPTRTLSHQRLVPRTTTLLCSQTARTLSTSPKIMAPGPLETSIREKVRRKKST